MAQSFLGEGGLRSLQIHASQAYPRQSPFHSSDSTLTHRAMTLTNRPFKTTPSLFSTLPFIQSDPRPALQQSLSCNCFLKAAKGALGFHSVTGLAIGYPEPTLSSFQPEAHYSTVIRSIIAPYNLNATATTYCKLPLN